MRKHFVHLFGALYSNRRGRRFIWNWTAAPCFSLATPLPHPCHTLATPKGINPPHLTSPLRFSFSSQGGKSGIPYLTLPLRFKFYSQGNPPHLSYLCTLIFVPQGHPTHLTLPLRFKFYFQGHPPATPYLTFAV